MMKKLLARWTSYAALLIGASIFSFGKMLLYAKQLNVEDFGIVTLLLTSYAMFLYIGPMGMVEGLLKLASMSQARERQTVLGSTAMVFGMGMTAFFAGIATAAVSLVFGITGAGMLAGFFGICLAAFAFAICEITLRSSLQFQLFSRIIFAKAVFSTVAGTSCILMGRPDLILLGEALAFLCITAYGLSQSNTRLRWKEAEPTRISELIRNGLPIAVSNLMKKLTFTADRWIIVVTYGAVFLGEYSFVMLIYLGAISLIGVANTAYGPTILSRTSDVTEPSDVMRLIRQMGSVVLPVAVLATLLVILFYGSLVEIMFPEYDRPEVIRGGIYVAIGMAAMAFAAFAEWFLIGYGRSAVLTRLNTLTLVVSLIVFAVAGIIGIRFDVLCLLFAGLRWFNLFLIGSAIVTNLHRDAVH